MAILLLETFLSASEMSDSKPRAFNLSDTAACLAMFDENCPDYFAPNERAEFAEYLKRQGREYHLYEHTGKLISAFGLYTNEKAHVARVNWIMVAETYHHSGRGREMMHEIIRRIKDNPQLQILSIAASQHSASFFEHFGAVKKNRVEHGWGKGMHRIDMELQIQNSQPGLDR